jgi:hypothetical protein
MNKSQTGRLRMFGTRVPCIQEKLSNFLIWPGGRREESKMLRKRVSSLFIMTAIMVAFFFSTAVPPAFSQGTPNLVGHWKFDEISGTSASDSSGNGRTGTLINGPTFVAGKVGNGINLDGVNDYVTVPSFQLSGTGFTLSAWINPASVSGAQMILAKGLNSNVEYYLFREGNHIQCGHANGGWYWLDSSNLITTPNQWYHVACTYNNTGRVAVTYINGTQSSTGTFSASPATNANPLIIGNDPDYNEFFGGKVDEVQIYNRALSEAEIRGLMGGAPQAPTGCESFETGFTIGQVVGAHADWFDSGTGPVVTSGNGLGGSVGLAPGSSIFTWTATANRFDWNAPELAGITLQMDFQTDANGDFDDDRMGWMTTDSSADSVNIFGVQLDTTDDGGIVTYWRQGTTRIQTPIVPLSSSDLIPNTWYRFWTKITKLTATSAKIDVELVRLDASGNPTGTPITGTLDDTSTWPDGAPDTSYFTASTMWPAYKNHNAITGAADNACFSEIPKRFAFVVTTDWHTSDAQPNTTVEDNLQQIKYWLDSPTTGMPAPKFMVITGDFPNLSQTQASISTVLGSDFLWYPVIGNHEISDNINNFYSIRDSVVPSLPHIVDYGPTGSENTSYSWDYGDAHFTVVNPYWNGTTSAGADSATDGNVTLALRSWIDADLAASNQTHKFAFLHEPAYPHDRHVGDSLDQYPADRDAFVSMLDSHSVQALFSGHTHFYNHSTSSNYLLLGDMHQITNGYLRGYDGATITYVLVDGDTATYRVFYRASQGSGFSETDTWTVTIGGTPPPTEPPAPPTGLTAATVSSSQISLAWTDNADNEANFQIERSTTGSGGPFSLLYTAGANTQAYNNTGLTPNTEYCYQVRAVNVIGPSAYTEVKCATTQSGPATATFQEGVNGYSGTVDTYIMQDDQDNPTATHGAEDTNSWDTDDPLGTGQYNYALIRFENVFGSGAGEIPVGSTIQSATLRYVVYNTGAVANVNEVAVDWTESVTWNTFGGDAGVQSDEYGASRGTASGAAISAQTVDVTGSLAAWSSNPTANKGWIFRPTGTDGVDFRSSEYATIADRPSLTVQYTAGGPPTCYALTLGHSGQGSNPVASPTNSAGCSTGQYVAGASINLSASPASGWYVGSWTGTSNNSSTVGTNSLTMPAGAHTAGVNYVNTPPPTAVCETFDALAPGSNIGSYPGWYDGGGGPVVTSAIGVTGSIGLAQAANIFNWTAHEFNWNAADFQGITLQADFQTDTNGQFDDDRLSWTTNASSTSSDYQFGVQLDHPNGGIVTYWRNSSGTRIQTSIVSLPTLPVNTWYRFTAEITKLTATSAKIDVDLVRLDASGNPTGTSYNGTVPDTSTWSGGAPATSYFSATSMWPSYKNYNAIPGAADNACYEIIGGTVPPTTTVTFQEGVNGYAGTQDTFLQQAVPGNVNGALEGFEWDDSDPNGSVNQNVALIRFDDIFGSGSGQVPVGANILSATLSYTVGPSSAAVGVTAQLHEVRVAWDESVNWNTFGSTAGVQTDDYDATVVADAPADALGTYQVNVTGSLQRWVNNPGSNLGWIFIPPPPGADGGGSEMESSEYTGNISQRPKLTVQYTEQANRAPDQPAVVQPLNGASGVSTSPTLTVNVSDPDLDPLDVTFYGRPVAGGAGEDFTIIVLPDTQNYSTSYPGIFASQTQWIVSNRVAENIVYVAHEGDIVNNAGSATEYDNADAAMDLLENPITTGLPDGIPYGVVPGNHDDPTTNYNLYFGVSRFNGRSYYGGGYNGNNDSNYTLFSAGGMDFIVINLEYNSPPAGLLDWADGLLKTHSNRRAIVVSHSIVSLSGNFSSWGGQIYEALKDNPNLFLTLSGHEHGEARRTDVYTDVDNNEYTVHSLLADYQSYTNGGNGYLRILRFSPANDEIYVYTYSPYLNQYEIDASSEFTIPYTMDGAGLYLNLGTVSGVASGSNASLAWPGTGLPLNTAYQWFAEASDGALSTSSPAWSFTTAAVAPTCYALTLGHTGNGSDPTASPLNSTGCTAGQYVAGENISLSGAVPDSGWQISGWTGTANNSSTASTNSLIMPAGAHSAGVSYTEIPPSTGWTAYNDLAAPNNTVPTTNITVITTNGGTNTGLPHSGELVNFADGIGTGVTLTVTGGDFNGISHASQGSATTAGDAHAIFDGKLNPLGVISYQAVAPPAGNLVLSLSGMDPLKTYTLVFYGNRNDYAWDRACLATLSGADAFTNQSSAGTDNNSQPLFSGVGDVSTRLPSDNDNGYVARFTNINPGSDGQVVLTISFDGTGTTYQGKYASALMVEEAPSGPSPTCYALTLGHTGQGTDPSASPANSTGCSTGQYVAGESISLSGATPSAGWQISGWTGTANNSSTASTNSLTMPGNAHSASVNYVQTPAGGWTAYNDCVYRASDQYIGANVTAFSIGAGFTGSTSGTLLDQSTGNPTGVTAALTQSGGVNWQPDPASGGDDTASGTDAYNTFHGIADMTGVIYYGSSGWYVDLAFSGLNPTKQYTFATSSSRGNSSYTARISRYTISGADAATNASTTGVTIINNLSVAFNTGDNQTQGYVARWTAIQPGADGSFTVRAEAHTSEYRAYAFDVFMLQEEAVAPPTCYALTLGHTGQGSNPVASPENSTGCSAGQYVAGENISLSGALPDPGWQISGWTGTGNDSSTASTNSLIMPPGAHTAGVNYVETSPITLVCETFNSFTPGSRIGAYTGWYDNGNGPVVTAGNGVVSSTGLGSGTSIFNWTAHPFSWNAADFQSVIFQGDFRTDGTGAFDDDRLSWTTSGTSDSSSNQFGVQLDHPNGGIVTYWLNGTTRINDVIVPLTAGPTGTPANTWYRFRAEIIKLTATSARIDVSLVMLDASGNPTGTPLSGSIADTNALASGRTPNAGYFTAATMYPSYKNYTTSAAPSDNICYQVVTSVVPPTCYTLTLGHTGQGSNPTASPANSTGCVAGQYVAGENISLSGASPASGWQISGWTGTSNDGSTASTNSLSMPAGAHTAGVNYTLIPATCYALTLGHTGQGTDPAASPANSTGCVSGQYVAGESISLSGATPSASWQIGSWTGTANNSSTASTNSLTMPASAHYAGVNYTEIVVIPLPPLPILEGDDWRYFKGTGAPAADWKAVGFDDSGWLVGPGGFGYGDGDDNTELLDMQNNYLTVYTRKKFTVADPGAVTGLRFSIDYDDGFVAYLNGTEIARKNVTGSPPAYNTGATIDHEASSGTGTPMPVEYFNVNPTLLVAGTNVLAIQGHNQSLSSSDFSLIPELEETFVSSSVCESFNSFTSGSTIGSYTGWYSDSNGPIVTAGNGVTGSNGLGTGSAIFNWTAYPFNWNAPDFQKVIFQGDFKTDGTGAFDDDRLSWTINGTSTSSNNQFGVQLDHPNGGIVTYWSNVIGGSKINDVIVPLTAGVSTQANTWYRFTTEITKLSSTSARIGVSLVMLDAGGNPTGTPITGSIADTSALASGHTPATAYFTATTMYPSYKNYTAAAAPADNTCYQAVTVVPPVQCYALTLSHTGQGTDPSASPVNSTGCSAGQYVAGENISLSGATPSAGWQISGWTGTGNDSSTAGTNSLSMPASAHTASVNYTLIPPTCYGLTLGHTGQGTDPSASPTNSAACPAGQYVAGESISLSGATPSAGWEISGWTGTGNDSSTAGTNSLIMPASAHTASVNFTLIPPTCYTLTLGHTGQGTDPSASPTNSAACPAGQYVAGESISLSGATPSAGWQISGWTGTASDSSTAGSNSLAMPAAAHYAGVNYEQEGGGRVTDGLVVLYDFAEASGTTVNDVSGNGTPLNLTIQNPGAVVWLSGGGLSVNSSAVISSVSSAGKVISALKASNAFTVEAWIKPVNTTQAGPARIVTCSSAPTVIQNFMVGAGSWGSNPSNVIDVRLFDHDMTTPAGTLTTALTHVVYTRDSAGALNVYINGVQRLNTTLGGSLSVWNDTYPLVLANEPTGNRPWLGEFHLVAVYQRALSQDEVTINFDAGPAVIPNDPPVVNGQSVTTEEDTAKAITLTGSDVDGDPLTLSVVTPPAHGSLSGTAPNLTYTPAANYYGPDSFTFKANDGKVDSNTATVSISVTAVNDAPVASAQSVTTARDTAVAITLAGSDVDGNPLTFSVVTPPAHGSLSGAAPSLTYTPDSGYVGPDSFTFKANDSTVDSNIATVSITITPVNNAPVADAQAVTTDEDAAKSITLTATDGDGDPLTFSVVTPPTHGSLSGTAPNLTYTPAANYHGPDSFTFKANDGKVDSNVATVSITVTAVNDAPVANAQAVTTDENTAKNITLAATDVDGDPLTFSVVAQPAHGSLTGTAPNLTYTPVADYAGPDSFTFKVNDGTVDSNIATVTITVNPESSRITDGLVALYDFGEGSGTTVNDVSGNGTPLNLTIQNPGAVAWLSGGGLSVNSSAVISSVSSAGKVISALKASNAFTVEAWIKPANTTQSGPARIVTCSSAPTVVQNFMVGTGTWGSNPSNVIDVRLFDQERTTPAGSLTTALTHVVYTRNSAGALSVYINGVERLNTTLTGSLSVWNDGYPLVLGNEPTGDRPWLGEFHLVSVYQRALSQDEVTINFGAGF